MVSPEAKAARERRESHWNYVEVLALLVAFLPSGKMKRDKGVWHQAIYDLREEYGERYPEFFEGIFFTKRPPLPPYSSQVSEFFSMMRRSDHMRDYPYLLTPSSAFMEMPDDAKRSLIERMPEHLKGYEEVLREMSGKLAESVALSVS